MIKLPSTLFVFHLYRWGGMMACLMLWGHLFQVRDVAWWTGFWLSIAAAASWVAWWSFVTWRAKFGARFTLLHSVVWSFLVVFPASIAATDMLAAHVVKMGGDDVWALVAAVFLLHLLALLLSSVCHATAIAAPTALRGRARFLYWDGALLDLDLRDVTPRMAKLAPTEPLACVGLLSIGWHYAMVAILGVNVMDVTILWGIQLPFLSLYACRFGRLLGQAMRLRGVDRMDLSQHADPTKQIPVGPFLHSDLREIESLRGKSLAW